MPIWNGKPKFNYQSINRETTEEGRTYDINGKNYLLLPLFWLQQDHQKQRQIWKNGGRN